MKMSWLRWAMAVLALVFLGFTAAPVLAQSTGGSFGGGSFGGGGGGGSYGGGSYGGGGGSYGGSYGGGGYGSYSGGGGGADLPIWCTLPVLFGMILFFVVIGRLKANAGGGRGRHQSHGARAWNNMDISAIRLGIDWRARREVQGKLEQLARSGNTNNPQGLARLLRETVLSLRRAEIAWLYADVANYHPMSAPMAEGIFRQLGTDARAKFRHELVRNADGQRSTEDTPEMRARKEEGEGVVVVTLIVAAKREILDVQNVTDANQLKALLAAMTSVANPQSLAAMEVIWSPAAENDRMSTSELEQNYPTLKKIDERSIAGRIFCTYCSGPYAMELLNCPHCGAPAPEDTQYHAR